MISKHTRKYLKKEHYFPSEVINRANRPRWIAEGKTTLEERAHTEVEKLIRNYKPSSLSNEVKNDLTKLMEKEAKKYDQDKLPIRKP